MKYKKHRTEKDVIRKELVVDKKLILPKQGLISIDGKPLRKPPRRLEELDKENKCVCIYVPNTWPFTYTKFFKNFLHIIHPTNTVRLREFGITDYFTLIYSRFPVCRNRNEAVLKAKKHGADYMMFLDSDMRQPPDIISQLAKHRLPIVSGMYFHQSPPHLPVVYKHKEGSLYTHYYDYPKHEMFEADLVGMGCLFVDMRVFDEMEMPYFGYGSDREDGVVNITEDVPFCEKARKAGFSIIIDPKIQCTHISIEEVTHVNFEAYMDQYKSYQGLLDKFGDGTDGDN